jgi:hypothetical protein
VVKAYWALHFWDKGFHKFLLSTCCTRFNRRWTTEQEISTENSWDGQHNASQETMVATEQEILQAEKEDTTQPIYRAEHNCKKVGQLIMSWF